MLSCGMDEGVVLLLLHISHPTSKLLSLLYISLLLSFVVVYIKVIDVVILEVEVFVFEAVPKRSFLRLKSNSNVVIIDPNLRIRG